MVGLEFDEVTIPRALSIGLVVVGVIGAAGLYVFKIATPACRNVQTVARLSQVLHDDLHLESVLLNNITTVSGGFFSDEHDCWAEVAQIRGNVNASSLPWRELRYRVVQRSGYETPVVTVELGGNVPLVPPAPSFWERVRAYL